MERSEVFIKLNMSSNNIRERSNASDILATDSEEDSSNIMDYSENSYTVDQNNSVSSIFFNLNNSSGISNFSPPLNNQQTVANNNNMMKEIFENILERLDKLEVFNISLLEDMSRYKTELMKFQKRYVEVISTLQKTKKELHDIDRRMIRTEQYVNRESIIISGIPESIPQSKLETTVLHILQSIGLQDVSSYQIAACHRLQKNNNDHYPARTIVRFTNRKIVQYCLKYRHRLVEIKSHLKMNLRFYESLCTANEKILKKCNELKRYGIIHDFFIVNGFIKIKKLETDNPLKIEHPDTLNELFEEYFIYDNLYAK